MQWACPPLLLPITVQRVSDLWQGAGLQVDGAGEGGEAFLTLPLPTGPDSGRQPMGTVECCMVPEYPYFVSGLIKLFGDTRNTPCSPCKITRILEFFIFLNEGTRFA